jgi:hypothetical protein
MAQGTFSGKISDWVAQTKERTLAVRNEAAQRVVEVMQTPVGAGGNMPVDTGFLRASLRATLGEPGFSVTYNPGDGSSHAYDAGTVSLVISSAHIEDTISAIYTANYAPYVEYGTSKMAARRFVGLAVQQWPRIVSEVAAEAQTRSK